jgi:hypothetical protein
MTKINQQRAKYFGWHPGVHVFFFTSNDAAFFEKHDAVNYARNLKDKTVDRLTRAECEAWTLERAVATAGGKDSGCEQNTCAGSDPVEKDIGTDD